MKYSPSLLAPCTEAQAASPAANSPGTIALGFSAVGISTSPKDFVQDRETKTLDASTTYDTLIGLMNSHLTKIVCWDASHVIVNSG